MSENGHDRWREDLAAYLLGALEPGEEAELERHVAGCEDCRTELRWLRPSVQLLPDAVARVEAPPELREKVLAQARSEAKPAAAKAGRRSLFGSWRPVAGLAAMALVVVAIAGFAIVDGDSGGGPPATVTAGGASGVTAKVEMVGEGATLRVANVHALPSDKILEAWVQREGRVTPVSGLFVPDNRGTARTTIADMNGVEAVMVTAEPRGGSPHPTSPAMVTLAIPE